MSQLFAQYQAAYHTAAERVRQRLEALSAASSSGAAPTARRALLLLHAACCRQNAPCPPPPRCTAPPYTPADAQRRLAGDLDADLRDADNAVRTARSGTARAAAANIQMAPPHNARTGAHRTTSCALPWQQRRRQQQASRANNTPMQPTGQAHGPGGAQTAWGAGRRRRGRRAPVPQRAQGAAAAARRRRRRGGRGREQGRRSGAGGAGAPPRQRGSGCAALAVCSRC